MLRGGIAKLTSTDLSANIMDTFKSN
jgi:hypothetical protein